MTNAKCTYKTQNANLQFTSHINCNASSKFNQLIFNIGNASIRNHHYANLIGQNSEAKLHGFLSYLVKVSLKEKKYSMIGYKGKQVRDNIHSSDLVNCFWEVFKKPKKGEVYNIGGGRFSNCSVIEW